MTSFTNVMFYLIFFGYINWVHINIGNASDNSNWWAKTGVKDMFHFLDDFVSLGKIDTLLVRTFVAGINHLPEKSQL